MPLRSMTGFARTDGSADGTRFHWEIRSVNGRGLDIRMRLPQGCEGLEPSVRELSAKSLTRGNISATLTLEAGPATGDVRINERALATLLSAVEKLAAREPFDRPRPEGVLGLRGIIEVGEGMSSVGEALREALLRGLATALDALVAARRMEGERIEDVLRRQVDTIEGLVRRIAELPMNRTDIADHLGLTVETLSRLLGGRRRRGAIRLHGANRIEICDHAVFERSVAASALRHRA